jgi:hypothetical protein
MERKIPDPTKSSLHWRLADRAHQRRPDLTEVRMRYRANFAYVDGVLAAGRSFRCADCATSAISWGFAIYRARHDDFQDNILPSGSPTGSAEEALDWPAAFTWPTRPRGRWTPDVSTTETTSTAAGRDVDVVSLDHLGRTY